MIGSIWTFLQTVVSDLEISVGFGIGMFFESLGIPFAAAPMLVVASARSSSDPITYLLSVLFGSIGATLGSMLSYAIGRGLVTPLRRLWRRNRETEGKGVSRARKFLMDHGERSILWAQLTGTTRTFISFPAGAMGINFYRFTTNTALGVALWCILFLGLLSFLHRVYQQLAISSKIPYWLALYILLALVVVFYFLVRWLRALRRRA